VSRAYQPGTNLVILPESPKALAVDGTLAAWAMWVITVGAPAIVTLGTAVLIILRIVIAVRELRR
jgi:hypothetical protein